MNKFPTMVACGVVFAYGTALADTGSLDAAVGGAVGGGLGAYIGNEVGGHTSAIAGGAVGAAAGAAIATDKDGDSYHRAPPVHRYPQAPAPYHRGPPGYVCPPGQAKKGRC